MFAPIGSHLPILVALARRVSVRDVVEFGSGAHSTPAFLRRQLFPDLTKLVSYEDNQAYYKVIEGFPRVECWLVSDLPSCAPSVKARDLVLVDNDPWRSRIAMIDAVLIERPSGLVVFHDCESYYYDEALSRWPYVNRYTPVPGMPDTAVLTLEPFDRLSEKEIGAALELLKDEVF